MSRKRQRPVYMHLQDNYRRYVQDADEAEKGGVVTLSEARIRPSPTEVQLGIGGEAILAPAADEQKGLRDWYS